MQFFLQEVYLCQYLRWDASGSERLCNKDYCGLDPPLAAEIGKCNVTEAKTVGEKKK